MKKVLFCLLIFAGFSVQGFSQIEKRSFLLGGHVSGGINTFNLSFININPNAGYFVSKRFCPGLSTNLTFRKHYFSYSFNPFVRYYFNVKEKRSFYGLATVSLAGTFITKDPIYGLGLGHVWFLNKNVGFEALIIGQTFSHQIALAMNFGFQIYLNRGKSEDKEKINN